MKIAHRIPKLGWLRFTATGPAGSIVLDNGPDSAAARSKAWTYTPQLTLASGQAKPIENAHIDPRIARAEL